MWSFAQGGMSPLEALRSATIAPARSLGFDRDIGSLEVGKLADLIVLEENLFDLAPSEIKDTEILLTLMNGQARHGDLQGLGD